MLNSIFTLGVILMAAFGLYGLFGVASRLAPLVSVALLMNIVLVMAMTGMLKAGVVIAWIFAAGLCVAAVAKNRDSIAPVFCQ